MTRHLRVMSVLAMCAAWSAAASASHSDIKVEIVDSGGTAFQQVPAKRAGSTWRAYLEAEADARYRIRITNSSGRRVGVVVAVDGRNIISGARSELQNSEPMYILDAWSTQEYRGWRANLSEVNEFYFTDWKDSYAEAFGDRSARGVIAIAAYREKVPRRQWWSGVPHPAVPAAGPAAPAAVPAVPAEPEAVPPGVARDDASGRGREAQSAKKAEHSDPGTGYGDRRVEHATRVEFASESHASQQVFLKYEWRESLCARGVLSCESPPNRFWPERSYGFAPPPPRR